MTGFALYRFPHEQQVTLVEQTAGEPEELLSCADLSGRQGFVVAPFAISSEHPIVLIRPDSVEVFADASLCHLPADWEFEASKPDVWSLQTGRLEPSNPCFEACVASGSTSSSETYGEDIPNAERRAYGEDFRRFHEQLKTGRFRKLVLSRCAEKPRLGHVGGNVGEDFGGGCDVLTLFQHACQMYPRLFVALTYTSKSGLWLTATPEILLEGEGSRWHTIALAGTMRLEGEQLQGEGEQVTWSTKNIQEQRYVATYIMECLKHFSDDIREEGPRTVRAANLVHLRSDFSFSLLYNIGVGELLQALHPTPAVCGLPKGESFRFILNNEHTPRLYYSGFQGPLNFSPVAPHPSSVAPHPSSVVPHPSSLTRLYVSLRCMQITPDRYRLYAGGGLLSDSDEEQEWQETVAKQETMRTLLAHKPHRPYEPHEPHEPYEPHKPYEPHRPH